MLLVSILISTLFLIQFSLAKQCPSTNLCSCSLDFTIVQCINRQLTNDVLVKLNNQLTNSTILLNLSSNSLTSIKSLPSLSSLQVLDLSFNKIRYLPPNIFSKFPRLTSLYIRNISLKILPKTWRNLSTINFNLSLPTPSQQTQTLYDNQRLIFNCSSHSNHYWTFNRQIHPPTIISSFYSSIILHHLHRNHSGIWTCHNSFSNHSISLTVLTNSLFCQSIQMNTSKGYFYWPRTSINQRIETQCPHGSAAWLGDSNRYARASFTCSSNGQWKNFDISQCGYQTNISRAFDHSSLDERNLLLHLVKYLAEINRNQMELDDILFLIDLIDEQQEKYQNQDQIMLIYHLTDFILQIQPHFKFDNHQYQLAMNRLRLIIERLLDLTNQSWLYIGKELTAMTLQSPSLSTLCFIPNRSLLTINCEMNHQQHKSQLVTIAFPSNTTNQYALFRMIVYRQSKLFAPHEMSDNPVVYIRPVSTSNVSTIRLTFFDSTSDVSMGVWNVNQTFWQRKSPSCTINSQNDNIISADCTVLKNHSLSITYLHHKDLSQNIFLNQKYSQIIIAISSIIASICYFTSILFYTCFHRLTQIPRRHLHCLINYWLSLGILLPLFAFGIELRQYPLLCQIIGIALHYLCLTTIIWLTLITYAIWRKLYVNKDQNRKSLLFIVDYENDNLSEVKSESNAVIQFYLLAYGIALIICGINVVISREQNLIHPICFLNHFDSMLIFIIPILISIFLLLVFLLFARNSIKNLSHQSGITTNEILPILNSSTEHTEQIILNLTSHSADIDHQYQSINQLLAILSQLILLIFLFLSSLTIYLRPLHNLKLRFEHIIYSHFYGFFVIFLAFYILSFHVLSRCQLIIRHYFPRNNDEHLFNRSLSIDNKQSHIPSSTDQISILHPSYSHDLSQNTATTNDHPDCSKRLTNITSKYYILHEQTVEGNSSRNISHVTLPISSLDTISRENIPIYQSSHKRSVNIPIEYRSISTKNIPLRSSSLVSSQSFTHPPIAPSQAIIRPIPIIRLASENKPINLSNSMDVTQSNDRNSDAIASSSSTEEYVVFTKSEPSSQEISTDNHTQVLYIDEDDERSVSLKSTTSESRTTSCTKLMRRNLSQTLSISSLSSSSTFSNDFYPNLTKIHESSV